jgi:hypothetical protein
MQRWTQESIAMEIVNRYERGEGLNYSSVCGTTLLSAAIRNFGSWASAIAFAGLDYETIRRTKSWSRERIVDRIRDLHAQGADLSWLKLSTVIDPQLAAAATKRRYFGSWREALEAAGLDYDAIRRYQEWSDDRVLRIVRDFQSKGTPLNAKNVELEDVALITAARRRFDSWPEALTAAGLDYRQIAQRAAFKRKRSSRGESACEKST